MEDDGQFCDFASLVQTSLESQDVNKATEEEALRSLPGLRVEQLHIVMDLGDEYDGEGVSRNGISVPHGNGVFVSACGRYSYVGGFIYHQRDGYGKLVSEHFVLWCKWRMDSPDLSSSARLDYLNGDRYSGFLEQRRVPLLVTSHIKPCHETSQFSMWAQSCAFLRCGWGELVAADGDRYFGEWENDSPHGFGCYVTREGDRYIGRFASGKFHGAGTLFSHTFGSEESVQLSGVRFRVGGGSEAPSLAAVLHSARRSPAPAFASAAVVVLDGLWSRGRFRGEGHVTLPNGTRVTAEWRGPARPCGGEVVAPPSRPRRESVLPEEGAIHEWRECFHWESLLCGSSEVIRANEVKASAALRDQYASSTTFVALQNVIIEFLNNSALVQAAVKVFQRCFYFLFGTCGRNSEIDPGLGNNPLGWCCVRNAFWGCIHFSRGKPITAVDLELALLDIFSLTRSLQRWVHEVLLKGQDSRFGGAGANTVIGRWLVDTVLQSVDTVLINLYVRVYSNESLNFDKQIERMRGKVTLDDMGVKFARRFSEERLFDPYADAVHCINRLGLLGQTLTSRLSVLMKWFSDINLSTRLAQMCAEEGTREALNPLTEGISRKYQPGSTDDLLPIYQYVISQCCIKNLYAHVRMLADFSTQESFVDLSSHDNFRVTTFLICAIALIRLSQPIRDDHNVLVPSSFRIERMMAVIESIPKHVCKLYEGVWTGEGAEGGPKGQGASRLLSIVQGYVKYWVPHVIERAAYGFAHIRATHQPACLWLMDTSLFDKEIVDVVPMRGNEVPTELRWLCWRVTGSLMRAIGLQFGAYWGLPSSCFVEFNLKGDYNTCAEISNLDSVAFAVTYTHFPLLSFLLYATSVLRDAL